MPTLKVQTFNAYIKITDTQYQHAYIKIAYIQCLHYNYRYSMPKFKLQTFNTYITTTDIQFLHFINIGGFQYEIIILIICRFCLEPVELCRTRWYSFDTHPMVYNNKLYSTSHQLYHNCQRTNSSGRQLLNSLIEINERIK